MVTRRGVRKGALRRLPGLPTEKANASASEQCRTISVRRALKPTLVLTRLAQLHGQNQDPSPTLSCTGERTCYLFKRTTLRVDTKGRFDQSRGQHQHCSNHITPRDHPSRMLGDQYAEQKRRDDTAECRTGSVKHRDCQRAPFQVPGQGQDRRRPCGAKRKKIGGANALGCD